MTRFLVAGFLSVFVLAQNAASSAADKVDVSFGDASVLGNGAKNGRYRVDFPPPPEGATDPHIYSYEPACVTGVDDVSARICNRLNSKCADKPNGVLVQWYRSQASGPQDWRSAEQACMYGGEPPERPGGGLVVAVTERQLRELPIVAPLLGAQPGRHTLKGAETNLYAEPAEQSFELTIAGRRVQVRVAPVEYRWSYGDGTALSTAAPGGPVPLEQLGERTETSHVYRSTGDVTASLTTVFTGRFSVDGGPLQPIAGTAAVTSVPRDLSVWRSEVRLYADDCNTNPNGQGC